MSEEAFLRLEINPVEILQTWESVGGGEVGWSARMCSTARDPRAPSLPFTSLPSHVLGIGDNLECAPPVLGDRWQRGSRLEERNNKYPKVSKCPGFGQPRLWFFSGCTNVPAFTGLGPRPTKLLYDEFPALSGQGSGMLSPGGNLELRALCDRGVIRQIMVWAGAGKAEFSLQGRKGCGRFLC